MNGQYSDVPRESRGDHPEGSFRYQVQDQGSGIAIVLITALILGFVIGGVVFYQDGGDKRHTEEMDSTYSLRRQLEDCKRESEGDIMDK